MTAKASRLNDVQAAHDWGTSGSRDVEHAAIPGLLAIARTAYTYREAVESGSGEQDGGIALQITYRDLLAALAEFEAGP